MAADGNPPPGWYPYPGDPGRKCYWDGERWEDGGDASSAARPSAKASGHGAVEQVPGSGPDSTTDRVIKRIRRSTLKERLIAAGAVLLLLVVLGRSGESTTTSGESESAAAGDPAVVQPEGGSVAAGSDTSLWSNSTCDEWNASDEQSKLNWTTPLWKAASIPGAVGIPHPGDPSIGPEQIAREHDEACQRLPGSATMTDVSDYIRTGEYVPGSARPGGMGGP